MEIEADGKTVGLTHRQLEVMKLAASDMPNKTMATVLGRTMKTVEKHRMEIYNRLNIHSPIQLTHFCILHGIVVPQHFGISKQITNITYEQNNSTEGH